MKFTIARELLLRPLSLVCGVVERRQTLPILSNLLLAVKQGRIYLTTTDLEVEVVANVAMDGPLEEGEITVPARKLLDICRTLPEQAMLNISLQKERLTLRAGKSRYQLATLPASAFPKIDTVREAISFNISQKELKRAIESTQFAMAQQDVRYYLNGILLVLEQDRLTLVATDGHRLALCKQHATIALKEPRQAIIPRKGVMEIARMLVDTDDVIQVDLGTNHAQFSTEEMCFTAKLIDGRFPDYQAVLPKGGDKTVTVERAELRQALTRAAVLSNEKHRSVRFHLTSGMLRLYAQNPEQEEAEEELAVDYQGQELIIGFNSGYLLDTLTAISADKVQLILSDPNSSCLIQANEESKYVVMPMRI